MYGSDAGWLYRFFNPRVVSGKDNFCVEIESLNAAHHKLDEWNTVDFGEKFSGNSGRAEACRNDNQGVHSQS
jgi:hypothetical protein